ncbi:MAG: putative maltokinase [Nitrospira sp.]|nr:putative maltokinase [Nitrospira sp.]
MLRAHDKWTAVFEGSLRAEVEAMLPAFFMASRWFGGKAKTIRSTRFVDVLQEDRGDQSMLLGLIEVSYCEGGADRYALPVTAAFGEEAEKISQGQPQSIIGPLTVIHRRKERSGILYDALWKEDCAYSLLTNMGRHVPFKGSSGTVVGSATELWDGAAACASAASCTLLKGEQSNTSVKFGDCAMMKLYRRVEPGMNPELEISRILTARHFAHSPALVGSLEYIQQHTEPTTLALAHTFVANQGNAWDYTLAQLSHDLERTLALAPQESREIDFPIEYGDAANLLGRRTGELHLALGQPTDAAAFAPEPCSPSYVQARVQAMQQSAVQALGLLRHKLLSLSEADRELGHTVLAQESLLLERLGTLSSMPLSILRIRCHGDYHLGQVLYTGDDFVIIDFEGEPAKPLTERRTKALPMVDLAGMIRSFHYAAHVALRTAQKRHPSMPSSPDLVPWLEQWYRTARTAFLRGYHSTAGEADFSPRSQAEFALLLDVHLLDKALYELAYELNNRPEWVGLPLTGIVQLVDTSSPASLSSAPQNKQEMR